jgi:hypothetical protein
MRRDARSIGMCTYGPTTSCSVVGVTLSLMKEEKKSSFLSPFFVPLLFCYCGKKPLPYLLRLAYENHRILLMHWTRPAPLETFLVPPQGGFDWRATNELAQILKDDTNGLKFMIGKEVRQMLRTRTLHCCGHVFKRTKLGRAITT